MLSRANRLGAINAPAAGKPPRPTASSLFGIALAMATAADWRANEPWRLVNDDRGEPYIVTVTSTHAIRLTCSMDFILDIPEEQEMLVTQLRQALGWPVKSGPATIDIDGRHWPAAAAILADAKGLTIAIVAESNGPAENAEEGDTTTLLQAFMNGRHLALAFHRSPTIGSLPTFEAQLISAAGAYLDLTFACPTAR